MKRIFMAMGLAFALAMPIAGSTIAIADPYYEAARDSVTLYQHSFGRGAVRCQIQGGINVNRHWGENWSRWIYVRVMEGRHGPHTIFRIGGCSGWVDKNHLRVRTERLY